jgi:hypothetical protein
MDRSRIIAGLCALLLLGGTSLRAESPTESVARLWNVWSEHHNEDPKIFNEKYIRFSRDVADVQGAAVIAPIMKRAKDWTSDEVLIFVAVVAFVPPENSQPILERYKKFGKPWERKCATDLLIELDTPDVKEMVARETKSEDKP